MRTEPDIIHCIGDSHVSFFSGNEAIQPLWPEKSQDSISCFRTYRLGGVLADSLSRYGSSLKGRELLSVLIDRRLPIVSSRTIKPNSKLMYCFGEIDCRVHIVRQSERQNKSIESVASETAQRYMGTVLEAQNLGYEMIVWNVVPTTNPAVTNPDYPHTGTYEQRIIATTAFNRTLKEMCLVNGIKYLDIYDRLVMPNGEAKLSYFKDTVHLNQKAMPLVIDRLRSFYPDLNIKYQSNSKFLIQSLFVKLHACRFRRAG